MSAPVITTFATQAGPIPLSQLDGNFSGIAAVLYQSGTYSPTWTGTGTGINNPAIGNGTLTGAWTQNGNIVNVQINMRAGSTTVFGNRQTWHFGLPITALSVAGSINIVDCLYSINGTWGRGDCVVNSGDLRPIQASGLDLAFSSASFTATDFITLWGAYQIP